MTSIRYPVELIYGLSMMELNRVTAVIPFLAYTLVLRSVEASKAGIIATIEPVIILNV